MIHLWQESLMLDVKRLAILEVEERGDILPELRTDGRGNNRAKQSNKLT